MAGKGVLALDMATSTGWALLDRDGTVTSGVQRFVLTRGESVGMRFLRFRRFLRELIMHPSRPYLSTVDVIAYERAHHRGGAATALCVGMATVLLEEAAILRVETTVVPTMTLKKFFTGRGNAGKDDMAREAMKRFGEKHLLGRELASDDEADALAVLEWARAEIGT